MTVTPCTTSNAAANALAFLDFAARGGCCHVHETSPDGASYITVFPLVRASVVMTMDTPVRVVTVSDGEALGGDDFATLRDALFDLYGVFEGETAPAILTTTEAH